ncbi:unnamed protein product [Didymodactylos carnosus]|uniref:Uncharacterized protein n=2 Tax=Didymodactylos carnosus TaxID=1234261 RepID=A0A816CPQ8_9BILA|nr:unnamed protein product [Didymodactylos carnosus]CAF4517512.1 unnamed protein product [Didymodactylos carnosus]
MIAVVWLPVYICQRAEANSFNETKCSLLNRTLQQTHCQGKSFCYDLRWFVTYRPTINQQVSLIDESYSSYHESRERLYAYEVGQNYTCYYKMEKTYDVKWQRPINVANSGALLGPIILVMCAAVFLARVIIVRLQVYMMKRRQNSSDYVRVINQ